MSFLPKYQWLTENRDLPCGGCDIVQIDASADKKFQVAFTPTELINENFDGNDIGLPMEKIFVGLGSFGSGSGTGEYYGITFDLDQTNDNHFVNSFSFFFEGQAYVFIFAQDTSVSGAPTITEYGNFILVKFTNVFKDTAYEFAFNTVMNDFGISIINNGSHSFTVYGFPENTQVQTGDITPYNTIINDGVGTETWGLSNFFPIDNKVCFFQRSRLNTTPGATGSPSIFKENIVIAANKRVIFTVNFTNSFADETTLYVSIKDNLFATIATVSAIALAGTNTLTFNYTTSATPPSSYTFDFRIESIASEIFDSDVGFCFNSVKIETIERLSSITATGCTTANVPFTEDYNDVYNSLITMTLPLPNGLISTGKWKLTLTDDLGNTVETITYETIDGTSCVIRNLMRLKWYSDCMFGNLDYSNLPFVNDVYVKGYYTSQPIDNKERIVNTLSSGELEMIYNYSLEKKEFALGIYTEIFYRTLQRAFEHKTIIVDDIEYKQDVDSKLTKKPEGNKYSARIELVEVGSAVISSKCCC